MAAGDDGKQQAQSRRMRPLTLTVQVRLPVDGYTTVAAAANSNTTTIADNFVSAAATTTTGVKKEKMAALIRHGSLASVFKSTSGSALVAVNTAGQRRYIARQKKTATTQTKNNIESTAISLAARGFLRSQKSYEPPKDMSKRIDKICETQAISAHDDTKLEDLVHRFKLFVACETEFNHSIPNSLLHTIECVGDLKRFYQTPVDNTTPYEALRRMELPKNLHIQQNYHRFHPDTDTMFNGKTAFPRSSTIVTGLKYKKKYPGHTQDNPWLDEQMKI